MVLDGQRERAARPDGQRARLDAAGSPREAEALIRQKATHAIGGGGGFH